MSLEWYGDKVKARILEASRLAIDETMAEAVDLAAAGLPGSPGGHTRSSVEVITPARPNPNGFMHGHWGSRWFLVWIWEVGSFRARSGWTIKPMPTRGKKVLANKERIFGPSVRHRPIRGRHALRRAADQAYRGLARRIRRHYA